MLELRPGCECCDVDLPPVSDEAWICTFECTFCTGCVEGHLAGICPNCGGELLPRPRRPEPKLAKNPASTVRIHHPGACTKAALALQPGPAGRTAPGDDSIRPAGPGDLDVVMRHRKMMFEEMGFRDPGGLAAMLASSTPIFARGLSDGSYRGWLVEAASGEVVAGGGVISLEYHSHPREPAPRRSWVVNMYTEPAHRRRGLARRLMETILEWGREEKLVSLYLHASADGRPLYENLGFTPTREMRLELSSPSSPRRRSGRPSRPPSSR